MFFGRSHDDPHFGDLARGQLKLDDEALSAKVSDSEDALTGYQKLGLYQYDHQKKPRWRVYANMRPKEFLQNDRKIYGTPKTKKYSLSQADKWR